MNDLEKKGLEKLIDKAFEFIDHIVKPPFEQIGGILADQVRFWRYKNQVNILLKAKEFHEKKGVPTKTMPVKTLVNLLEAASYEEDLNIQEKWAAMLFNATDPSNSYDLHNILVDLLKQLSPLDIKILDFMYKEIGSGYESRTYFSKYILSHMRLVEADKGISKFEYTEFDKEKETIIVENFIRLNLIEYYKPSWFSRGKVVDGHLEHEREVNDIRLTNLGFKLVQECQVRYI